MGPEGLRRPRPGSPQQDAWKPWPPLQEPQEKPLFQASSREADFKEAPGWPGLSEETGLVPWQCGYICMGVPSALKLEEFKEENQSV